MQYIELADFLGIRKQNINMWVKQKQNIPKKHLPVLEEYFGIDHIYFIKELTEIEKLEIQKEKLKKDLQPVITRHEKRYTSDVNDNILEIPIYDKEEINAIERDIEKAKLVIRFKGAMDVVDNNPHMDTFKLIVELMEKVQHESVLKKTIEAIAHYLEILTDRVSSSEEQREFETELFEVLDEHNH